MVMTDPLPDGGTDCEKGQLESEIAHLEKISTTSRERAGRMVAVNSSPVETRSKLSAPVWLEERAPPVTIASNCEQNLKLFGTLIPALR